MSDQRYLSAKEAAARLEISLPTLYAYVSRGLIRSESAEGKTRQRRYHAEDVDRLLQRKHASRYPESVAENALNWGTPVLESAITLIDAGKLYYRGHDAIYLARYYHLEDVATLIWDDDLDATGAIFTAIDPISVSTYADQLPPNVPALTRIQMVLPLAQNDDLAAFDRSPGGVKQTGARILRFMVDVIAGIPAPQPAPFAHTLAHHWQTDHTQLINAAMILCADHELNASSFVARVTASTGATPYSVISAGIATLQGVKHGGHTERVAAFLREVGTAEQARPVIAERLRRGDPIPGFGHRLYPDGDPRATALLGMMHEAELNQPALALGQAITEAVELAIDQRPTIDFALAILAHALDLPAGSPFLLFLLGRTVGWIGHALEQYGEDQLIRPRARYTGPHPTGPEG